MDVLIAGAGVGGLALARGLLADGHLGRARKADPGRPSCAPHLHDRQPATSVFPQLTERDREVLGLLAKQPDRPAPVLSPKTVAHHISNILAKLQPPDRAAAIIQARRARARRPPDASRARRIDQGSRGLGAGALAQIEQDSEDSAMVLVRVGQAELRQYRRDVRLDRPVGCRRSRRSRISVYS